MASRRKVREKERVLAKLKAVLREAEAVFGKSEDEVGVIRSSANGSWDDRIARISKTASN